ncbi:T-complex protein 10a, partial [Irineochytrium annulatum]
MDDGAGGDSSDLKIRKGAGHDLVGSTSPLPWASTPTGKNKASKGAKDGRSGSGLDDDALSSIEITSPERSRFDDMTPVPTVKKSSNFLLDEWSIALSDDDNLLEVSPYRTSSVQSDKTTTPSAVAALASPKPSSSTPADPPPPLTLNTHTLTAVDRNTSTPQSANPVSRLRYQRSTGSLSGISPIVATSAAGTVSHEDCQARERDLQLALDRERNRSMMQIAELNGDIKRLKKEKLILEKNKRASEVLPSKRERQEMELMRQKYEELLEEKKRMEHREKLTADRHKKRVDELLRRNTELQDEVKILERERASYVTHTQGVMNALFMPDRPAAGQRRESSAGTRSSQPPPPPQPPRNGQPLSPRANTVRKQRRSSLQPPPSATDVRLTHPHTHNASVNASQHGGQQQQHHHDPDESLGSVTSSGAAEHSDEVLRKVRGRMDEVEALAHIESTVAEEAVLQGGKVHRTYADGSLLTWYHNGAVKATAADKEYCIYFENGDYKQFKRNGEVIYWYSQLEILESTMPDGMQTIQFLDSRQVEKRWPDGTIEVEFPDGTQKIDFPNGRQELVFPNGSIATTDELGNKTVEHPDGTVEYHYENYKQKITPDGTIKLVYPDGRHETRFKDGRILIKNADGKIIQQTLLQVTMIKEPEDPSPDGRASAHANRPFSMKLKWVLAVLMILIVILVAAPILAFSLWSSSHSISTYSSGAASEIQMLAGSIADGANTNAFMEIWNIPSADTSSCLDTIMGAKMGVLDVEDFDLLLNWFLAQFARNTFASYYQWGDAATGDFMGWVFSGKQE